MSNHYSEAKAKALEYVAKVPEYFAGIERVLLIDDIFGQSKLVIWLSNPSAAEKDKISTEATKHLKAALGVFWTGNIWFPNKGSKSDEVIYEQVWDESRSLDKNVRINERYRNHGGWFTALKPPLWETSTNAGPPILAFYSFKGGVGRTTALAAFALQCADRGESVAIIDLDLDAPGVGSLLSPNPMEMPRWGVVDYLIERALVQPDVRDFYFRSYQEEVTGSADIFVFPAGIVDSTYLGKLARVDLEPAPEKIQSPLESLVDEVRSKLNPRWILIDARPGLSNAAGLLMSGLAHMHVLFGTNSEQSWQGLKIVLDRLGAQRFNQNHIQAECVIVQSMVPDSTEIAKISRERFAERALDEFTENYYVSESESDALDNFWTLDDAESFDAPHVPIPIHYSQRLAYFAHIGDVARYLKTNEDYKNLSARILSRFSREAL